MAGGTRDLFSPSFNRSVRIEERTDRLTGEAGAIVLREVVEKSGIVPWLVERLEAGVKFEAHH